MSVKTDEQLADEEEAKKALELKMAAEEEEKAKELEMAEAEKKKEEEMAAEKEAEEKKMADEEEEKKKEEEEEMAAKAKKEKMSLDANLDVKAILGFLIAETEEYKRVAAEVEKLPEEIEYSVVLEAMISRFGEMASTITEMEDFATKQKVEIEELAKYKSDIETQKFEYEVNSTLKEVENIVPVEKLDELRAESAKYSIEDLDGWKNSVKALAFTFTNNGDKKKDKTVHIAVPWISGEGKRVKSPWQSD